MEQAKAIGKYFFECYDKDGNRKWIDEAKNLVVTEGLQYMAGTGLDGATSRITVWYIGLVTGPGASNTYLPANTMSSHAGWAENIDYSEGVRQTAQFAASTPASPSVVTNAANKAEFTMNNSATIAGAFLTSNNTKNGTTGTLFSVANFQGGDRSVANGDTLQVTYQFSLSA
jgi:hypothetical protein